MVRKHSPRRCRLGGPKGPLSTFQREVGPGGVFEAFERSKNASLEKASADADIISFDVFESGLVFSESSIHDLSRDVFCPKKMFKKFMFPKNALKRRFDGLDRNFRRIDAEKCLTDSRRHRFQ